MHGMLLLLGAVIWLILALGPLYMLWRRRKWIVGALLGLPFAGAWVAAPFWDYFFMVPAINEAYAKLAVNKVYKVSDARKIRVRHWQNDQEVVSLYLSYDAAILAGKVDFIEELSHIRQGNINLPELKLTRYSLQPLSSEGCWQRRYGQKMKDNQYCISYEYVEASAAEVVIDEGTVYVTPREDLPDKRYQYSFWRAKEAQLNSVISEQVNTFIWDPDICYFFNACRYVVDRDWWLSGPGIESSVKNISVDKQGE